jgi:hypothetical protein
MRRMGWVATAAGIGAVVMGGARIMGADGQDNDARGRWKPCTLRGDYGGQIQGTRPVPPPSSGLTESVIGVVFRTYDGQGNFSQVDNVKGSITGTVPDRSGFGTYEVNPDCTASTRFQPGPGILIEEQTVIVDNGREIRTAVMVPAGAMVTGVAQRIHTR